MAQIRTDTQSHAAPELVLPGGTRGVCASMSGVPSAEGPYRAKRVGDPPGGGADAPPHGRYIGKRRHPGPAEDAR